MSMTLGMNGGMNLSKNEPIGTLNLFVELRRRLGSNTWMMTNHLQQSVRALRARKERITDANDRYSTWLATPEGMAWSFWEVNEDGNPPNGGPEAAGVKKPSAYDRAEETSLGHRLNAALTEEAKCKGLYDWFEDQLGPSWDAQKKSIADNNSTLTVYEQLQRLKQYVSTLGLGKASLVSAELMRRLQALPTADDPMEVNARLEKIEEIVALMELHHATVLATVDEVATAAAIAQLPPEGVDVVLPVVYHTCPDIPTRDVLYNLLSSLVTQTLANQLVTQQLYNLEAVRASWDVITKTVKLIVAATPSKRQKTDHGGNAMLAHCEEQYRHDVACAAQLQQQQMQQQQHEQFRHEIACAAQQQQQQQQEQQQQFHQQQLPMHQQPHMMAFSASPRPPVYGRSPGVCYAHQRGECHRGDSCRFSHDSAAPAGREASSATTTATATAAPTATQACIHYQQGRCLHGNNCRFRHDLPGTLGTNFRGAGAGGM